MARHRILIAIPAYNEVNTIGVVISSLRKECDFDIIVFDDGSVDGTDQVAEEMGALVSSSEINLGYEATINRAFNYASETGYYCIIYFDADGEHDPEKINQFNLSGTEIHAVVGNRSNKNRFSEKLACRLTSFNGIFDPYCGMKSYNLKYVIRRIYEQGPGDHIGFGLVYAICLTAGNDRIKNIPIKVGHRSDQSRFSIGLINANLKILTNTIKVVVKENLRAFFKKNFNFS